MKWDTPMWCLPKTLWWLSQKKKRFLERNWLRSSFWMNFWVYLWILSLLSFIVFPDLNGQWISYLCPTVSALPMGALMYTAHLLLLLRLLSMHLLGSSLWRMTILVIFWLIKNHLLVWYFELETFINNCCKDQIWIPSPTDRWTETQKVQNNEFVDNGLENWALMNQTNTKVDLDNKKM